MKNLIGALRVSCRVCARWRIKQLVNLTADVMFMVLRVKIKSKYEFFSKILWLNSWISTSEQKQKKNPRNVSVQELE